MNCLRTSPGTVRKPAAILRKCAAQACWSIEGGRRYCTIAVIIGTFSFRLVQDGQFYFSSSLCSQAMLLATLSAREIQSNGRGTMHGLRKAGIYIGVGVALASLSAGSTRADAKGAV